DTVYLNNASTGPLPARTIQALGDFNDRRARPHLISDDDELAIMRRAREQAARVIGASVSEIALQVNTSYGINLAARALPLQPGDVVVAPDREFPANVYPWMALADKGVRFEMIPCVNNLPDEDAMLRALDAPGVRALTVSWVSFATGYRVDLHRLGSACRERGIYFVVDAIQGVGCTTMDVHALAIDILACGGQKYLLSPWGSAFAYVREELVRELRPTAVGWMSVRGSDDFSRLVDYDFTYHDDARRFEVVTLPYQDLVGFTESVGLLLEVGIAAVEAHVDRLVDHAVEWCRARDDVRLVTPERPTARAGIVALAPRDAGRASARLTRAGVVHSVREGTIRLAPHFYNTLDEVQLALDAIAAND
ncbi:MAG TPA: aminotransferase class V-fold PLP-dependent enzyme, partial [Gemmatimonadaceae bacterium]|nr:aminotransferase class V-fold PLP-dependent enzyme [Gemmatimonadaceae bacterium]